MPSVDERRTHPVGQRHSAQLPVSGIDKSVSETVKTREGTVDDPCFCETPHPESMAERLDEQLHSKIQRSR